MIEAEASLDIARPPAAVFDFVCELEHAPSWLEGCVSLALEPPGAWNCGATLQYEHEQGGHAVRMTGVVAAFEPGRVLRMEFADAMFGVDVELRFDAVSGGTRVSHTVAIELKGFALRLMAPVIRVANQKQVRSNLERLRLQLEVAG